MNLRGSVKIKLDKGKPFERVGRKATYPAVHKAGQQGYRVRTAHISGCISHGLNDATIGGAVLLTNVLFLKKIRILYFLPLLAIFALCSWQLPAASASTVTLAWNANPEPGVEGYILYYGTTSPGYLYSVDVGNSTSCTISGVEPGTVYYFAATAYNTSGESEFSEEISYEVPLDSGMPDEVIIDNGDEGTSFTGTWDISSCPEPYGEDSLYSWDQGAHYDYEAQIEGTYTVSLWWTEHATMRSNSVPVEIFDGDTLLDTVYVNQQANGGQWNELGEYDFSGTARVVVVSEGDSSTGADAARFVSDEIPADIFHISASAGSGGYISPDGDVTVDLGSSEAFAIVAGENRHIADVTVDGTSIGAVSSYTFNDVSQDHTITATFALNTYTISAQAGEYGTISPPGTIAVDHGSDQTYSILPHENCHIVDVKVDGKSVGTPTTYTFSNVISNHTIVAQYAANVHTITASAGPNGAISPQGETSVNSGSSLSFTIAPAAHYHVLNVVVDGASVGAVTAYTFDNITTDHTISASFATDIHTITASAGANGGISPQGAVSVDSGSSLSFTITPEAGYHVLDVVVDGASVGAVTSYTFSNVTGNHTITAAFEIDTPKPPPSPNEIIIDNGDEGTSFTGTWTVSSCPNPYGENSLYSWDHEVHYTYQAPVNGTYTVSLWWTEHATMRSDSVPVQILDGDTLVDTVYVNQQANGGQWNELGNYAFSGIARVVVVSEGDSSTGADAVGFSSAVLAELDHIEVEGPASVNENANENYECRAFYTDGSSRIVQASNWQTETSYAVISSAGVLTTSEVSSDETIQVQAAYTENSISRTATFQVTIKDGLTPADIIIDNGDEGTSFTGTWTVSSCPNPYGPNSLYSWGRQVHYTYQAPVNGTYTVLLWWTEHATMRSDSVPVQIFDGDTLIDTVYVNQQANGGQWNELGNYAFNGTAKVVVVSEGDSSTAADAVRFSR